MNLVSLKFVESWILSRLSDSRPQIKLLLLPAHQLRRQWNTRCDGISPARVRSSLLHLLEVGDIQLYGNSSDGATVNVKVDFNSISPAFRSMRVELTAKGSQRWEILSNYDWLRHGAVTSSSINDRDYCHLVAGSGRHASYLVRNHIAMFGRVIRADTLEWEIVTPWQATYWKSVPFGVSVSAETSILGNSDELAVYNSEVELEAKCEEMLKKIEDVTG